MDPTTTLVTFMLSSNTEPSVRSVRLIGSWDNFSASYPMERDSRRDRGQWKGCYSFRGITCDDARGVGPARDGGLKMGSTYHYYYELDGSHETHDPARPSTRHCPYMPGQTVNALFVPVQHSPRKRSASLSSMRPNDFMTTNPRDKYAATRPAPPRAPAPILPTTAAPRLNPHAAQRSVSRSPSPAPSWRRFFRRDRCPTPDPDAEPQNISGEAPEVKPRAPSPDDDDARSARSCGTARSRDMSPESLRRFLRDDAPPRAPVVIPEAEEDDEGDDDENFAEAAGAAWGTVLAPPPVKRAVSAPEVTCSPPSPHIPSMEGGGVVEESPVLPDFGNRSRFSFSSVSSCESDAGTPGFWGLGGEGEGRGSYELPSGPSGPSGTEKRAEAVVGVEGDLGADLQWMVDVIKS